MSAARPSAPVVRVGASSAPTGGGHARGARLGPAPPKQGAGLREPVFPPACPLRMTASRVRLQLTVPRVAEASRGQIGRSGDEDRDLGLPEELFGAAETKYRRVMLKLSGEALQGSLGFGIDPELLRDVARDIAECQMRGVQMAVVVGGGNYFRGVDAWDGLDRATADYVGMMATCMNAICLQSALESLGVPTRVQTAIEMKEIAEPYIRRKAVMHLEKGRVVIFGAGTGNPFFTTDTAAALRAAEIGADVLMKATKVDGVYDSDPANNPDAKRYARLSYKQVTNGGLNVMDETAITLCKENQIPCLVFNLLERGNIIRAVFGEDIGTTVEDIADFD